MPADATNLRIVELHYNPADHAGVDDEQDLEFIELLNPSSQTVSLDGVTITQFANDAVRVSQRPRCWGPGQRIVVARTPSVFQAAYGMGDQSSRPPVTPTANLSNGGERIALVGPLGQLAAGHHLRATAGSGPPRPTAAGQSLEIINPLGDPSSPANWRASYLRRRLAGDLGA